MFIFMYLVKLFGDKAFKRESLGGGDIKLAFFIGCTLGLRLAFVSLIIASFSALCNKPDSEEHEDYGKGMGQLKHT